MVLEELRSLRRTAASRCGRSAARWWGTSRIRSTGWTTRLYRARGRAIGSGPIESACKTVIGKRMKDGGMRWGGDGADEMCHLRALFSGREDRWDAYWHPAAAEQAISPWKCYPPTFAEISRR